DLANLDKVVVHVLPAAQDDIPVDEVLDSKPQCLVCRLIVDPRPADWTAESDRRLEQAPEFPERRGTPTELPYIPYPIESVHGTFRATILQIVVRGCGSAPFLTCSRTMSANSGCR